MKKTLLFLLSLTGLIASGLWMLQEGGYEPAITLCASLTGLVADFWLSQSTFSSEHLNLKTKYELMAIAKGLGIGGINAMNKDQIIAAIVYKQATKKPRAYSWHGLKWFAVLGALPLTLLLNHFYPKHETVSPKYELAWYEKTENGLRLVNPESIKLTLDPQDVLQDRLLVPIRLAVRNADNSPLEVVRVELRYDRDLKVSSSGKAKIDPRQHLLIYEHAIGTLENIDEFTPIETVDIVTVPFNFFVTNTVAITKDRIPIYMVSILGESFLKKKDVTLGVRVFCSNRPPVAGTVHIQLDAELELITDFQGSKQADLKTSDEGYFTKDFRHKSIVSKWRRVLKYSQATLDYTLSKDMSGRQIQAVGVDGILRRVTVDANGDGNVDFTLMDTDGDGRPDHKWVFPDPWPLVDWEPDSAS